VRDYQVPWTAVSTVDVVNAVRVHCEPAPGAARGKVLYSWAVQSSPRATRRAALRREARNQPRPRLTPRPRVLQPPPSTAPRGYGELPDSTKEALERSSADFTAGRLAERAQHARRAAARAAGQPSAAGATPASATPASAPIPPAAPAPADGTGAATGPAPASEQAGAQAANAAQPEPWFANVAEEARPAGEQAGTLAGDSVPVTENGAPASDQATGGQVVTQWAWLSIAAMVVPLALLILVVLV
jgi:hypothetical protein